MSDVKRTYTYRTVKRIELEKSSDNIVVRTLPEHIDDAAVVSSEQGSSASTQINISNENLEALMGRSRCEERTLLAT